MLQFFEGLPFASKGVFLIIILFVTVFVLMKMVYFWLNTASKQKYGYIFDSIMAWITLLSILALWLVMIVSKIKW